MSQDLLRLRGFSLNAPCSRNVVIMAIGDDIKILNRSELFRLFNQDALRLLAFAAEHRSLKEGEVLFRKGDRADSGYVVKQGSLLLISEDNVSSETKAGEGALIGRLALFIRNTRPVTAVAAEPTDLIKISPILMRRVLEEFPECAQAAHDLLAQDLETLAQELNQVRPLFE